MNAGHRYERPGPGVQPARDRQLREVLAFLQGTL